MKKHKIIIEALTEKGEKAIKTTGQTSNMEKATIKLFGIKENLVSESPLMVETVFKRVPEAVFQQIILGLHNKMMELGAKDGKDYNLTIL